MDILGFSGHFLVLVVECRVPVIRHRVIRLPLGVAVFLDDGGVRTGLIQEVFVFHNSCVWDIWTWVVHNTERLVVSNIFQIFNLEFQRSVLKCGQTTAGKVVVNGSRVYDWDFRINLVFVVKEVTIEQYTDVFMGQQIIKEVCVTVQWQGLVFVCKVSGVVIISDRKSLLRQRHLVLLGICPTVSWCRI